MPSNSSRTPNVNRGVPVYMSWPTVPNSSPRTIIASALIVEPRARAIDAIKPEHDEAEELRRSEGQGDPRQRRREEDEHERRDGAGDE